MKGVHLEFAYAPFFASPKTDEKKEKMTDLRIGVSRRRDKKKTWIYRWVDCKHYFGLDGCAILFIGNPGFPEEDWDCPVNCPHLDRR